MCPGKSFQLAIIAPHINLIGCDFGTEQNHKCNVEKKSDVKGCIPYDSVYIMFQIGKFIIFEIV